MMSWLRYGDGKKFGELWGHEIFLYIGDAASPPMLPRCLPSRLRRRRIGLGKISSAWLPGCLPTRLERNKEQLGSWWRYKWTRA